MAIKDWAQCPTCHLPARCSSLALYAAAGQPCPVCEHAIAALETNCVADPHGALADIMGSPTGRSAARGRVKATVAALNQLSVTATAL